MTNRPMKKTRVGHSTSCRAVSVADSGDGDQQPGAEQGDDGGLVAEHRAAATKRGQDDAEHDERLHQQAAVLDGLALVQRA